MRGSSYRRLAPTPEDDVDRAGTPVARVGVANRRDLTGMPGGGKPVADGRPDRTPLAGFLGRRLARDQEQQTGAAGDRLFELPVDKVISGGEVVAVEIQGQIGLNETARQSSVPAPIKRRTWARRARTGGCRHRGNVRANSGRSAALGLAFWGARRGRSSGEGTDRFHDPAPKLCLVSVETSNHRRGCGRACRAEAADRPSPLPTCRQRSRRLVRRRPRRCRTGWRP